MIVNPQPERAREIVFHELSEACFTMHVALGCADDIVAVREKPANVRGGVRYHVKDMPDVFSRGNGRPLQREAERRRGCRNSDLDRSHPLTLCAPDCQSHAGASAVAYLDGKGVRVRFFNLSAVDADDKVIPGLNGYVVVLVAEDLEAEGAMAVLGALRRRVGVEAGYETIEGPEHVR